MIYIYIVGLQAKKIVASLGAAEAIVEAIVEEEEEEVIVEPKAKRAKINNKIVDEPVYNSREER